MSCPTVADGMVLISLSRNGLQQMLNICHAYACKWRFEYNPLKCGVIVFNEKSTKKVHVRQWNIGSAQICEVDDYTHLGITCNKFMDNSMCIQEATIKLRGTLLSISNSGLHPKSCNPVSSRVSYTSIVIPRALYECELWNTCTSAAMVKLEVAHRFCMQYVQRLNMNTSTYFTLSCIDMPSIETILDYRKLQFFGQLCRLSSKYLYKQVFTHRVLRYYNVQKQYTSFIADIYRLLVKYGLR